jgi:hypothetical protein
MKHEFRQALPLNWVDRKGKGGKFPRRFVYMKLRETAFDFGDFGATCNVSSLGYDGVQEFRDWAATYGSLHPFMPSDLAQIGQQPIPDAEPEVEVPAVQPVQASKLDQNECADREKNKTEHAEKNEKNGLHPSHPSHPVAPPIDQGCRDPDGHVTQAWITPGKPEWWQELEQRLIEATTLEQLQQAKSKTSASRRTQVMNEWSADGRYEWIGAKAARLQAEAEQSSQGNVLS